MNWAIDKRTGLTVQPNPGSRASCPYCKGEMEAHCGAVLDWHWAHIGASCREWDAYVGFRGSPNWKGEEQDARRTCPTCAHGGRLTCRRETLTLDDRARRWRAAWLTPAGNVQHGAPQCPVFRSE
jgi:hypothetical protein